MEVCEALPELGFRPRTGKLWRHPQQDREVAPLIRSYSEGRRFNSSPIRNQGVKQNHASPVSQSIIR